MPTIFIFMHVCPNYFLLQAKLCHKVSDQAEDYNKFEVLKNQKYWCLYDQENRIPTKDN